MQSGIRRHVDDAAVLLGAEVWSTGADESECAAEVDVEHAVPCVVVHLPQHAVAKEPGVVDQDVDASGARHRFGDHPLGVLRLCDIGDHSGSPDAPGDFLEHVRGTADEHDVGVGAGERLSQRTADAFTGTGDDDCAAGEVEPQVRCAHCLLCVSRSGQGVTSCLVVCWIG